MSQVKLIVSNWKMNFSFDQAENFVKKLKKIKFDTLKVNNIICPQFILMPLVSKLIKNTNINLGAQDCHYKLNGAFTGDTSVELLKNLNCNYIILGHSERRQNHFETDELINFKVKTVKSEKLKPIICIGENLKERESGKYKEILKKQLQRCIPSNLDEIIIAYEPIWSIGTGHIPSIKEIKEIQDLTINFLKMSKSINNIYFLYGGSVNADNLGNIMNSSDINGALIGGSSLKIEEMKNILTLC